METISVKLVIVGDGAVGKTSMLLRCNLLSYRYSSNKFPKEYEPTIFENSIVSVKIDHQIVNLGLWYFQKHSGTQQDRRNLPR
jgi:GTPase SAR1 family protein